MNQIKEIKLPYSSRDKIKISSSKEAYKLFSSCWSLKTIELQEEFKVLLLDENRQFLGIYLLSKGVLSETIVDVKLVYNIALKCNASMVIVAHNHPSGNLQPIESDVRLNRKLKELGTYLDISLLDHLIITNSGFYSFADWS
jgi:DNA repair protein RadC